MAATGMDTNPELFPHTAQLLLLSTTETQHYIIAKISSEQTSFSLFYMLVSRSHSGLTLIHDFCRTEAFVLR